jgi:hypothetical protein
MPKIISSRDKGLVQSSGRGFAISDLDADLTAYRVHQEKIIVGAGDDDDVAALAAYKLPAGSVIHSVSLTVTKAGETLASAPVAVEVHNESVAFDDASAGVEIAGADIATATNVLGTDRDLDVGSEATLHDSIIGEAVYQPVEGDETFLSICAKADLSTLTGSPTVLLTVIYTGRAPIAV